MKWLTLTALCLTAFSAQALVLSKEQLLNPKLIKSKPPVKLTLQPVQPGQPVEPIEPLPEIPPTRMGRMKFEIVKSQIIKHPDGSYSTTMAPVCVGEMDMPVWDVRNVTNGSFNTGAGHACSTTLDGQPITLKIGGHLWIANRERFDEPPQAEKSGSAFFYNESAVTNPNNGGVHFGDNPGTRDLMNRSLIGNISQNLVVCSPSQPGNGEMICEVPVGEYFSASVELIDNP